MPTTQPDRFSAAGRHRRPETLADAPLRPVTFDGTPTGRRRAAPPASRRRPRGRGKHARPGDPLAITVKPLTPAAVGSHRAPGTLPIEAWVLAGRPRQQALLAALVAVGLALVMIPVARPDEPVSPVNVAGESTVINERRQKQQNTEPPPADSDGHPAAYAPAKPSKPPKAGAPATAPSSAAPPAASAPPTDGPLIEVPPGDGPHRSLRTTGSRVVALTFDDGPDPVQTPAILAMLAEYQVQATFCLVGEQVEKHPEIVRQIVAAGHVLCNHTWDHDLKIGKKKPAEIRADLRRTDAAIRAAAPGSEIPFFRAPGGNFSGRLVEVAYQERMRSLYWEVDPADWQHKFDKDDDAHVARVVADIKKEIKPGAIVLSHDFNQPGTILAYAELLPWLSENFELGVPPVGELPPPADS